MSSHVRSERVKVAEDRRRDRSEVSGEIAPLALQPRIVADSTPAAAAVIVRPPAPPAMRVLPSPPAEQVAAKPRPMALDEASILPELPRADYVPNLRPSVPSGTKPLLWIGLGAALASVIFFVLSSGVGSGGSDSSAASSGVAAAPTARDDDRTEAAVADSEPTGTVEGAAASPPEPAVFDAEKAGVRAVEQARPCLSPDAVARGVSFGIGLLVDHESGRIKKTYFSGDADLPWPERKCMRERLQGRVVSPAPPTSEIVSYYARIRGDEVSVKVK
jgi:hypothetical protein